jgi:tRNA A-37 threonylcarbamoyl transferase component Bud32
MTQWRNHGEERGEHASARPRRGDVSWTSTSNDSRYRRPVALDVGLLGGRFEVGRPLGDGSFASVFEARDLQLDRKVAIKLFTRYERDELDAALHEARAMAKLRHPNVLIVHDIGEHRGTPFLALEYCQTDMRRWLEHHGPHTPERIVERFIEAGRGLAAAHAAGLVHHDFKPANVLLREDGSVAVGDFGLAQPLDTHETDEGDHDSSHEDPAYAVGTLRYIAPERLLGHAGDPRSDQFSFCVALWEALAGEHPFTGTTAQGRYESIAAGPCVFPRVARHLIRALERGLAADPQDRFPSMAVLLDTLVGPVASARWTRPARPLLTAAGLAFTFLIGLGFAPDAPTLGEADATSIHLKAAEQAMIRAHDLLFDGDHEGAIRALEKSVLIVQSAPLAEQREFIGRAESLGELFEKDEDRNRLYYAAQAYSLAAELALRAGTDARALERRRDDIMIRYNESL